MPAKKQAKKKPAKKSVPKVATKPKNSRRKVHAGPGVEGGTKVFNSMRQASARLGLPFSYLQQLKAKGADGFRSNTIYWDEVEDWIAANPTAVDPAKDEPESLDGLKLRKLILECERLALQNAAMRGSLVPKKDVEALTTTLAVGCKGVLLAFVREYPAILQGLDAAQIRVHFNRMVDSACEGMAATIDGWSPTS